MKKIFVFITSVIILILSSSAVYADGGKVTYNGDSREYIFSPGSDHSPTDMFTDLKGVMPGDKRSQKITVRNDSSKEVKTKIWLRSEYADESSADFLSKLQMSLSVGNDNGQAYMFSTSGSLTPDNDGWILLGLLYSGGEVDLTLDLYVPTELDNSYMDRIGFVDWTFKTEEFPKEPDDPVPPKTGDTGSVDYLIIAAAAALLVLFIAAFGVRKIKEKQ